MPVLSNSTFACTTPSGATVVMDVQPQHLNEIPGMDLNRRALNYGRQLAHKEPGGSTWYKPGGWEEITDPRTIALLERAPAA